jgi:hypothetical protein
LTGGIIFPGIFQIVFSQSKLSCFTNNSISIPIRAHAR